MSVRKIDQPRNLGANGTIVVMNLRRKNIVFFIVLACMALAAYISVMVKVAQSPVM